MITNNENLSYTTNFGSDTNRSRSFVDFRQPPNRLYDNLIRYRLPYYWKGEQVVRNLPI